MKGRCPKPICVDFETLPIRQRPLYPPAPVSVSIKHPGKKAQFWAWGHPTGNNCTFPQAQKALREIWSNPEGLLFQNGKFDIDVAEEHMGMPRLPWASHYDTLFLLFLDDPHQTELGLKPSAERLLGMAPDERDAVGAWLLENQPLAWRGIKMGLGNGKKNAKKSHTEYYGAYIALAPGDLVGKYANGDVERTEKLFKLLWQKNFDRGMNEAYDRERRLMPLLLDAERQGIPVDLPRLRQDVEYYGQWHDTLTGWVKKELNAPALNLNSGVELVNAMIAAGKVDVAALGVTPKTGKPRTDKESLAAAVSDPVLLAVLKYCTQLGTCLHTFMRPWLHTAELSGGLIFTSWNQVKSPSRDDTIGTRTGRLSSTPNFQNIPKEFDPVFHHQDKKAKLPKCPFKGLPPLPLVRGYIIPWAPGEVLIDRDYSQQEPRILAHFEGGALMDQYIADPWIDFHDNAKAHLERIMGRPYQRKHVKNIGLGLIYGQGIGSLALKNGSTYQETKEIKDSILAMYPGLKMMQYDMKLRAASNKPIRTWGGREYYCEPPKVVDGEYKTYDYKMVNVLVQGSAADCTKEALIHYLENKPAAHRFYVTVHDEILVSTPQEEAKAGMEQLRVSMERVPFDVAMLSEGKWSSSNWAELKTYDKKGKVIE